MQHAQCVPHLWPSLGTSRNYWGTLAPRRNFEKQLLHLYTLSCSGLLSVEAVNQQCGLTVQVWVCVSWVICDSKSVHNECEQWLSHHEGKNMRNGSSSGQCVMSTIRTSVN
jgi:hypothetical protein